MNRLAASVARFPWRDVALAYVAFLALHGVAWWFGAYADPLGPDYPLPVRIHVLPCVYGPVSRVCVFERVHEARYSEGTP